MNTEVLKTEIVKAIMAREHAASGLAVFVDPVIVADIVDKAVTKAVQAAPCTCDANPDSVALCERHGKGMAAASGA